MEGRELVGFILYAFVGVSESTSVICFSCGLGDVFVSRGLVYLRRCTYVSASRSRSDELSKVAGGYNIRNDFSQSLGIQLRSPLLRGKVKTSRARSDTVTQRHATDEILRDTNVALSGHPRSGLAQR